MIERALRLVAYATIASALWFTLAIVAGVLDIQHGELALIVLSLWIGWGLAHRLLCRIGFHHVTYHVTDFSCGTETMMGCDRDGCVWEYRDFVWIEED